MVTKASVFYLRPAGTDPTDLKWYAKNQPTRDPNPVTLLSPTARFVVTPGTGRTVSVNGSTSSDPDGTIVSYAWTWGDGATATGATPSSHTYSADGTFLITLVVTDNDGLTHSVTQSVTVSAGNPNFTYPAKWTDTNPPWKLKSGESHDDNMPAGVPVVNASTYSSSRDLYALLQQIDNTLTVSSYVRLDAGVYDVNIFRQYSDGSWRGWSDTKKKVMGLIGVPRTYDSSGNITSETIIRLKAEATRDSAPNQQLVTDMLNVTATTGPRPTVLYLSNSGNSTPMFFSGLTFQGQLQIPFSVYSAATQAYFKINQSVASPIIYFGISMWDWIGRMQFCRFQGFGFAMNSAPPAEAGCVNSNHSNGAIVYRCEMDGRVSKDIDASQPRSSGGWMTNKEVNFTFQDCWEHHTRRSGNAYNTNTQSTVERLNQINYQCETIADAADSWAGDAVGGQQYAGFAGAQFEGLVGKATLDTCYFNVTLGSHVNLSLPFSGAGGTYTLPAPGWYLLTVKKFRTNDTLYGGCFRVGTAKQPNSSGISPLWNYINTNGVASANNYIHVEDTAGNTLTPVFARNFNATLHKPNTHYVLTSFT